MAVFPYFPTCLSGSALEGKGEEWEALKAEWSTKITKLPHEQWLAVRGYPNIGYRLPGDRLLNPAGCWLQEALATIGDKTLLVFCRLVEPARASLPDLFEAKLVLHDSAASTLVDISQLVPVYSEEEAVSRFKSGLASKEAEVMAAALGDTALVRAFGVAVAPQSMAELLKISPAPTAIELGSLSDELGGAVENLYGVLDKWQGTDALAYLATHVSTRSALRRLSYSSRLLEQLRGLSFVDATPRRRGRPIKGGSQLVIAQGIAKLWKSCGLGEPKTSPQSRFIRACSVVLPWHNVFKADVAQFMRGELKKTRRRNVVIG